MNRRTSPKVLLLQLEFPTWAQARAWTYPACFGVGEGLRAAGATCTTLPLFANTSLSPDRWLDQTRAAVDGQRFDQVWVWLVHSPLTASILEWISGLAPTRVGIVMESLTYDKADYDWARHLRARMQTVAEQSLVFTHVLVPDERDVESLAQRAHVQSLWWPTMVPERFIVPATSEPCFPTGVFHGHPYGSRRSWLENDRLLGKMTFAGPGAPSTQFQTWFDHLQASAIKRWASPATMTPHQIADYVTMLQEVREGEFREWMAQLPQWAAIVNLPSLAKFYGGRVYEGMAAGRPVLTYHVPDHPLNNSLFVEGEEVLCYAPDNPESLNACLERILQDRVLAERIVVNAQHKMRRYHTSERRLADTLRWIESGERPDYGLAQSLELRGERLSISQSVGIDQQTSVFVLTVDDPAFPACMAALDSQQGVSFTLEIIRNVSPFSAAAQKMITDCTTEFFIQVDEDMVLQPDAVATMEAVMRKAPDDVGMICFHLFDDDRELKIQGVKIYRASLMRKVSFQDVKASEMDLLEQMGQLGIKWILHPDVKGRHGTCYTPETIYRRYKTMYEKDIRAWNVLTWDLRRKAEKFRETGNPIQLFALLGAAHGIIEAPHAQDREKDFQKYNLKELEVFKRLLVEAPLSTMPYDAKRQPKPLLNPPIPIERVQWKHVEATAVSASASVPPGELSAGAVVTKPDRGKHGPIRPRVLLATPLFWPSIGGVEMIVDHLGVELLAQGYAVDVATIELPHRQSSRHRGMTIISLSTKQTNNGVVLYAMQIHDLVVSGDYQACIIICNPIDIFFYALANAQIPAQTRLLIQPVINKEVYDAFVPNPVTKRHLGNLLRSAAAAIALTRTGFDDRLMREAGTEPVYLPNAVAAIPASGDFRKEYGIPEDAFVILHVANLWEVKNHVGLLRALNHLPVGMRLVMIGHATTDQDYSQAVRRELEKRSDVLYIPGACPEKVSAAMEAADVVVLASHAEASPVCILEAMSHRKAWLATPECGAVAEHAGGIVTPLENFPNALALLKEQVDLRQALAQAGYEHWRDCYRWNVVIEGWVDLIETGRMRRSFEMPKDLVRRMEALTQAVHEALAKGEPSRSEHTHKGAMPVMSHLLSDQPESKTPTQEHTDAFYTNLFVKTSHWSTPHPNPDEAARWAKIAAFLEYILRAARKVDSSKRLRMIEVGCGRGWLTNLASSFYGTCEGVEPVAGVIEHARRLFPHLRFEAGTAETVLARPDFSPYDVVLCSEVIEHIPQSQKAAFVRSLRKLLKLGGHMIMTTPRGELWEEWKKRAMPNQPVEEWLSERELESLLTSEELRCVGLDRVYLEMPSLRFIPTPTPAELRAHNFVPIYQIWACEWSGARPATLPVNRTQTVSVIVPTCNRPDRLREALRSIEAQTYRDFEIVVVNDGTIDIEPVVTEFNREGRITYIRHDRNRGLAASRNTGLRAAKGKYIAYLDDDDRYLPNHLETLVSVLDRGEYKVAYTDAWRVHEQNEGGRYFETSRDLPYSVDFNPANLLVSNYFPVLCVMHERACIDEVGGFDESLFAHEDWDLWIRMATKYPFKHLKRITAEFTWRVDGSSMTSSTHDTYLRTTEIIYRKYAPYAERIAGMREAQQQHLQRFYAKVPAKSYACSIIMPVWNRLNLTKDCLTALSQIKDQPEYEVIVVDNGSTDGTKEFLAEIKGDVQIIRNEQNLGFAKACNQGARAAHGKYLVFLNNDTIPQIGWLSALVSEVDADPAVGIVGSKLLYPDGTIQHAGVVRDWERRIPYHIYKAFAGDHPAVNQRREFQIVTAACLLIRRALFEEVGGFDEAYVNGFEDADLCLKVRERGYLIIYQPRSVVIHLESQTPGRKAQDEANIARFLDRWGAQWWAVDEDLRFYQDGYKLKRIFRNGLLGGDIQPIEDIKERACWAHVVAAQTAALKKDWDAVKCELRLVDEWPDDQYVLSWGAMLAERLEESIWRTRFLSRYLKLGDAPAERLVLVRTLIEQKNLPDAEEQLGILLAASPDHAEGLLVKGVLCMQREQYQEAERAFSSALQQGADRRKCLMGMGMAAFGQVYHQGAWERFLQVLEECPDDAEAIHWLLRAGTGQNRWDELSRHLRKYLSRNPADLSVRFALAGTLIRGEQIEAAHHECDTLRSLAPTYDGLSELGEAISRKQAVSTMEASHS